jgi:DNA-binding transcriptional MerR regulator
LETTYTINQVELLSGIKSHTLRIWEKRYEIIVPRRTETNIRYFSEQDLKKILNISYLNKRGLKISKIAALNDVSIEKLVVDFYQKSEKNGVEVLEVLSAAIINYDLTKFKTVIDKYLIENSFEELIKDVIYPLFDRIGVMWQTNQVCPAQEHLFSNYIKQKLYAKIDEAIDINEGTKKAVIYLREGEYHELGMLVCYFVLVEKGYQVFYLGQSVPFNDMLSTIYNVKPDIVVSAFVTYLEEDEFKNYIARIFKATTDVKFYFGGNVDFLKENKRKFEYNIIENAIDWSQIL